MLDPCPPTASLHEALDIRHLDPIDLATIERQQSQRLWLGISGECDYAQASHLADQPVAWTARTPDTGRILACFGINETFPDRQGVAWALLGRDLGKWHLPLTRFIQGEIRECGLERLELLARCCDVEPAIDAMPDVTGEELRKAALLPRNRTPEVRWAILLGMTPAHVLRKFGGASETHMLFERIA